MNIAIAHLVKLQTEDGLVCANDGVKLKKTYFVDLSSIRRVELYNQPKNVIHSKEIVNIVNENGKDEGWFPMELLQIEYPRLS